MRRFRFRLYAASIVFAASLCVAVPAAAQAKDSESLGAKVALLDGPNRLQTLIEGAKKEGELTVYHSNIEDFPVLIDAFTKKYGIKVKAWRAGSEQVTQKIVTEARGKRFEADIVDNNVLGIEALHREKLLQPVNSPYLKDLIPQATPAHKDWVGTTVDIFVQAYNPNIIKKNELPKSYQDLLDPKWKNKLAIEAEDYHWYATLRRELGQEKGRKLFKDIVATNGISVRKGHSLLANLVVSGEVPLGLTLYHYKPMQLKQKGAAIDWFVISPAIAQLRGIGMLKRSPHPHAAVLFYDFMLNEGQQIYASRYHYPTSTKIDTLFEKPSLFMIDTDRALDLSDKWLKDYEDVLQPRADQ